MIRLRVVEACHFVCCGKGTTSSYYHEVKPSHLLPQPAQDFWKRNTLAPAERAVVAFRKVPYGPEKLIGFFRYYEIENGIFAAGTWVSHHSRGKGIARRMWTKAITLEQPKRIEVTAVSTEGEHLVASIKALYPGIVFDLNP